METCALCNKKVTEIENCETRFTENEKLMIVSKNLEFSPVYEVSKRLACVSCGIILYKLNLDESFEFINLPRSLTLPENRLKAVDKVSEKSTLTI